MRTVFERHFASHDGVELFYRHWPAVRGPGDRAVVLFHRGHEHSGRLQHLPDELALPQFAMFAWDARGLGRSPGERGYAEDISVLIKDVDCFVQHISQTHGIPVENVVIIGQSVGAVLAGAWVHDYAPRVRCLVLVSPALRVRLYVPFAIPLLRLLRKLKGKAFVNSYVKSRLLTHDPERQASYDADPLIARPIAVNILLDLFDTSTRLMEDSGAIHVPTQLLVSGADWVVEKAPQRRFFAGLSSAVKEWHEFPGFFHDTLGERDRKLAIEKAREFILRLFASPPAPPRLLEADRDGYAKREYDALAKPLPALAPKAIGFALTRGSMRTAGRLSEGVRLGFATGFDSGSTLDYVYRNEAHGAGLLGRLIDRNYLDSIGWRGIRLRKRHLERLLAQTVRRAETAGLPVQIVDIAAGHGRYVIECLKRMNGVAFEAVLRDYSEINVAAGRDLIVQQGLAGRVRFEHGDAFDRNALAALAPRPTIAIVSGLYELFPENRPVRDSLAGLATAVPAGGFLIYTNQPWHPQLELIARVLTSHRGGAAWVMRRRTQAEIDQLVEEAGFAKLDQLTDPWGIFTVSLARREAT